MSWSRTRSVPWEGRGQWLAPRSVTTISARADTVEVAAQVVACRRAGRLKFFLDRGTRGMSSFVLVHRCVAAAPSGTRVQASPCRRRHTSSSRRESRALPWSDSPFPDASGHDRSRGRAPRTASAPPVATVQVVRRSRPTSRRRHGRERPRERVAHQRARPSGRPWRRHSALLPTPLLGPLLSSVNEGYIDPETLGRPLYYRADSGGLAGQLPGQHPAHRTEEQQMEGLDRLDKVKGWWSDLQLALGCVGRTTWLWMACLKG